MKFHFCLTFDKKSPKNVCRHCKPSNRLDHRLVVMTTSTWRSTSCGHFLVQKKFSITTFINLCSTRHVLLLLKPQRRTFSTFVDGNLSSLFFGDRNIKMACYGTLSDFSARCTENQLLDWDRLFKLSFVAFTANYTIHSFLFQDRFQQNKLYLYKRL